MKMSISTCSIAAAGAAVFAFWTPAAAAQAERSPTLVWNQVALEAIERAKPTQHQAARLLAHVSLAQYAAAAEGASVDSTREAAATASMRTIAELMPSQAAFAEQRYRELGARDDEKGRRIAQRVIAEANADGFAQQWSGQAPQAA